MLQRAFAKSVGLRAKLSKQGTCCARLNMKFQKHICSREEARRRLRDEKREVCFGEGGLTTLLCTRYSVKHPYNLFNDFGSDCAVCLYQGDCCVVSLWR